MILILKHIGSEGPGTLQDYLVEKKISFKTIELWKNEKFPENMDGVSGVVVMGGPMNVYEEDKFPFLKDEDEFIKKIIEKNIPYLGICLGAQLLAKAAGAKVYKASHEEIGWYKAFLTIDGSTDALFNHIPEEIDVFHWHGDTFDIPLGGVLLERGDIVRNQAFRVKKSAYGLQFHIEADEKIIDKWFNDPQTKNKYLNYLSEIKESYKKVAWQVYDNFIEIVNHSGGIK